MPRHWQVLILAALGIGATLVAVPRALSGIVAVPQGGSDLGISRTAGASQTPKANTATVPGWSPVPSATAPAAADTKPPTPVTNLRITSNTDAGAAVSWDASSDNVGVRGYVVRTDVSSTETSALTWSFSWTGRSTGPITVQVAAIDGSGNRSEWRKTLVSPPKGTTTQAAVTTPPTATTTAPTTTAPAVTTTEPTTPPPSSEAPVTTAPPTQAGLPTDTNPPAVQQSSAPA